MLPYIFSILGTAFCAAAILVKGKDMRLILLLVFTGNALAGVSYLVAGNGMNGAVSCFLGAVIAVVNFFLERTGKSVPKWLTALYAGIFTVTNLAVTAHINAATVFSVLATLCFVLSTVQKSGKLFRICSLLNTIFWIVYDLLSASYQGLIIHITVLLITVAGMLIHDRHTIKEG